MPNVKFSITPSQQQQQKISGTGTECHFQLLRPWGPNGEPAVRGHSIGVIELDRVAAQTQSDKSGADGKLLALAANLDEFCSGSIDIMSSTKKNEKLRVISWERGYIAGLRNDVHDGRIHEVISICVQDLTIDDSGFRQLFNDDDASGAA
jgi:hypothetical protein